MGKFSLDDYKDVAERITEFYERFPEGSLTRKGDPQIMDVEGKTFVIYTALAYRDPLDMVPAVGTAWEPFPGPTQYTKDSELMNAETAAWGRAIVAAGISSKKIASRQEVRNREQKTGDSPLGRLREAFKAAGGDVDQLSGFMDELGVPPKEDIRERMRGCKAQQMEVLISRLMEQARKAQKELVA